VSMLQCITNPIWDGVEGNCRNNCMIPRYSCIELLRDSHGYPFCTHPHQNMKNHHHGSQNCNCMYKSHQCFCNLLSRHKANHYCTRLHRGKFSRRLGIPDKIAAVRPWDVYTLGVRAAKMTSVAALINILTHITIAGKPRTTHAFMRAYYVFAFCISITLVSSIATFVNVITRQSVPYESTSTNALVRADSVIAKCMITTLVFIGMAFINIMTGLSIPHESFVTRTNVRADSVIAGCINTTVVFIGTALINVKTRPSITLESFQATAHVGADSVIAGCMNTTGV
ncbi:hypothetical protein pdam_00020483, partial [Pocillopora damicornis]